MTLSLKTTLSIVKKTRIYIAALALLALATGASAQGEPVAAVDLTSPDTATTTAIPSLAELRSQVLHSSAQGSQQSSMMVPGEHRAFFCRFDDKLDKKKIPLRMRLGSVDEVNRMESKPGYRVGQTPL